MNLASIVASASVRVVLMFLWWSPLLFLQPWMTLTGRSREQVRRNLIPGTAFAIVGSLIMALGLALILSEARIGTAAGGAACGLALWLAFVMPPLLSAVVYEGRSLRLFLINGCFQLFALLGMGAVAAHS